MFPTNQKHYLDQGSDMSSVWNISALVPETSFRGKTSVDVAKCRLFSQEIEEHTSQLMIRVGQGFWVYGIQGLFKSGIRYIAA